MMFGSSTIRRYANCYHMMMRCDSIVSQEALLTIRDELAVYDSGREKVGPARGLE